MSTSLCASSSVGDGATTCLVRGVMGANADVDAREAAFVFYQKTSMVCWSCRHVCEAVKQCSQTEFTHLIGMLLMSSW